MIKKIALISVFLVFSIGFVFKDFSKNQVFASCDISNEDCCDSIESCEEKISKLENELERTEKNSSRYWDIQGYIPSLEELKDIYISEANFFFDMEFEISKESAMNEFEALQQAKNKNERLYGAAFKYMLKEGYLEGLEDFDAKDIQFIDIESGLESANKFQLEGGEINMTLAAIEYRNLTNLFRKAQENPIKEVRQAISNGGVLPGARNFLGGENEDVGTKYVGEVVIPKFVNTLLVLALSISTILMIIGGAMYIFSYGEEETKTKAKDIILWGIVGVVIIAMSYAIVKFVINVNFDVL